MYVLLYQSKSKKLNIFNKTMTYTNVYVIVLLFHIIISKLWKIKGYFLFLYSNVLNYFFITKALFPGAINSGVENTI